MNRYDGLTIAFVAAIMWMGRGGRWHDGDVFALQAALLTAEFVCIWLANRKRRAR